MGSGKSSDPLAADFTAILDDYAPAEDWENPGQTEERLVQSLEERFNDAYEARLPYERDWELFYLYLKGEQLIYRHKETGDIIRLAAEETKKLHSVRNVIRPTARSLVGKLTRTIPTCEALPATSDFEEQHGARAASALLRYARRKEDLDLKYVEGHEYLPWAGNSFLLLSWDRLSGSKLAYCPICDWNDMDEDLVGDPCPQCAMQKQQEAQIQQEQLGQLQAQFKQQALQEMPQDTSDEEEQQLLNDINQTAQTVEPPEMQQQGPLPLDQPPPELIEAWSGDFKVDVIDLRDVFPEPGASCLKDANFVIIRHTVTLHEIRTMFPEHAEHLKAEDNIAVDRTATLRYNSIESYDEAEFLKEHLYLYEFHEKPTEQFPKGRIIFKANDRILLEDTDPIDGIIERFPLFHFGFDKNCGEFWYEPFMVNAWHRQKEVNSLETAIREHVELALKPKMAIPMGSRITEEEFTAESTQLIKYNAAAGRPEPIVWPDLSAQVFGRRNELNEDIRMQAGITEQEAGISASDPNGRAMAIIEAEADQQVGPVLLRNHSEWRNLHRAIIQVFRARAHPDTKYSVFGPDGTQTFCFEDLILKPGWDVQVEQEDGLSRNKAIRFQQALELKNGAPELFMDPMTGQPDGKKFVRYAGLNLREGGYDLEATERAAASQLPYLLKQGQPHIPQYENDPMIFAEELLGWLRGPGRREDPNFVQQVRQIWMFYASWAAMGQPPGAIGGPMGDPAGQQQPGAGPGGPDMTAQGGSPNNPGHMGSDLMGQAAGQAAQADQAAEGQAQVQQKHEG